ncbi:hypothetical protein FF38_06655 [Lucilia cuprina]|uniref:Chitin-binding type-2 domain-containing protein n=1 Tax=Lucilia cuprina TaxID=7375 RepID=A0A0L0CFS8_LUCCU|nr:hypothetical protein FF38_06655 [Lucilia cuprina]
MLIKFWLTVYLFTVAANAESSFGEKYLKLLECQPSSTITPPCLSPSPCPVPTPCPAPAPTSTPGPSTPSGPVPPSCNNCPKPDCSMVPPGTTFPYANHCKLFYQCVAGNALVSVCPNGYWYDRALTKCMLCDLVKNCDAQKD